MSKQANKSKEEDKTCSICFGSIVNEIQLIDCTHAFCEHCIKSWVEVKPMPNCPLCRSNITEEHERTLFGQKISPESQPELEVEVIIVRYRFRNIRAPIRQIVNNRPDFMEPIGPVINRINNRPEFMEPIFRFPPIVQSEPTNTPVNSRPSTA